MLSLKPVEEHAPVMQQEQLWRMLMQPGDILVCNSSKEFVLNVSTCAAGGCVFWELAEMSQEEEAKIKNNKN